MTIVRAGERQRRRRTRRGHRYEVLTPPLPGPARSSSRAHTLAPGAVTGGAERPADARARQPRDRARRVRLGHAASATAQRYELGAGDCVTFDADLPHHFENPGPSEARLLAVVSAGLRRS